MRVSSPQTWRGVVLGAALATAFAPTAHAQDQRRSVEQCSADSEAAQRQRKAGKLLAAREAFRACANPTCPSIISTFCSSRLAEVESALPSVVVRARDATGDVPDLDVWIDDALVGKTDGRAITVDPGPHSIAVRRGASMLAHAPSLVTSEGEKLRPVVFTIAPLEGPKPASPAEPTSEASASRGPLPYVLGAIGVAALGTSTFLYASALSDRSKELRPGGCAPACSDEVKDSIRTRILVGDGISVVGVASLAVAAYLLLRPSPPATHLQGRNFTMPSASTN